MKAQAGDSCRIMTLTLHPFRLRVVLKFLTAAVWLSMADFHHHHWVTAILPDAVGLTASTPCEKIATERSLLVIRYSHEGVLRTANRLAFPATGSFSMPDACMMRLIFGSYYDVSMWQGSH